jgi:hypothetical protein
MHSLLRTRRHQSSQQKEFQEIIGVLLYITQTTPPEISIHVNLLDRRTTALSTRNLQTVKDICQYNLTIRTWKYWIDMFRGIDYMNLGRVQCLFGFQEKRPTVAQPARRVWEVKVSVLDF